MGNNSFGTLFTITTWGESHGKAVGVVIDGCPAGLALDAEEISAALRARAPGNNPFTSPRKERDQVEILSGLFEGNTTGTPLSILIYNSDVNSAPYNISQEVLKPGHAHYTYLKKYGIFDFRGGGRASARETVCRVAAGYVAKKLLKKYGLELGAHLVQIGSVKAPSTQTLPAGVGQEELFCLDVKARLEMQVALKSALEKRDSLGGVVEFIAIGLPPGLGEPLYQKLEAQLAHAMLSLPASKGFEIGSGFHAAQMQGSEHNDLFTVDGDKITTETNLAGGVLAGISTSLPLWGKVAFKPTSSIGKPQQSVTLQGEKTLFTLPEGSRHDPCVAIRAVPVVEAMLALVLIDLILLHRARSDF